MSVCAKCLSPLIIAFLVGCASVPPAPPTTYDYQGDQVTLDQLKQLAYDKNDIDAKLALGDIIEFKGPPGTYVADAKSLFLQVANTGNLRGELALAELYLWMYGDVNRAIPWYEKASAQGSANADAVLWFYYQTRHESDSDAKTAYDYYEKTMQHEDGQQAVFSLLTRAGINKHKYYPKEAMLRGASGVVVVGYDYYGGGKAVNVQVERSSGDRFLDQAAADAVKNTPFSALPDSMKNVHHFRVVETFTLNK